MAHISPHDSHSTSTPPPSPPLTGSRRGRVPKQFPATAQSNPSEEREHARLESGPQTYSQPIHAADCPSAYGWSQERRSRHSTSESSPRGTPDAVVAAATDAAAATAAVSYTSHEMAIAYSMVTSDSQHEEQDEKQVEQVEQRKQREQREQREQEEQRQQRQQLQYQNAKHRDQ
ncbi:hypothetical protein BGZ68_007631, partial [Mortierella alpina]